LLTINDVSDTRHNMARPLCIEYPGAVYHVMNRGGSRQKIFLDEKDRQVFLNTIGEIHDRWGVEVFGWCLMANHYHLCLRTPEGNLAHVREGTRDAVD
jgi:REP-associated tyrosine transposase